MGGVLRRSDQSAPNWRSLRDGFTPLPCPDLFSDQRSYRQDAICISVRRRYDCLCSILIRRPSASAMIAAS